MRIVEVKCARWFLSSRIHGIVLYPFIFYNTNSWSYNKNFESLRRHEWVHVDQVRRYGWFTFYSRYVTLSSFREQVESEAYSKQSIPREVYL